MTPLLSHTPIRCFGGIGLVLLSFPGSLNAQFTDPRAYDSAAVGTNQLELGYVYARANASIDTSLVVGGAELNLNQGTIDYSRYFSLIHRVAWVEAILPFARLDGSVTGANIAGSTIGLGDSSYELSILLKGAPALSAAQFANYKPATIVGLSVTVTAPTGRYDADRILNLGSDRWAFKPEVALSHPFGPGQKWEFDAYGNAYFFTDNKAYHGVEILRQLPLAGIEGHISYSFTPSVSASFDTRYSFAGETFVDGVNQSNAQQNLILGSELTVSPGSQNNYLVLEFGKGLVHRNGPAYTGIGVRYVFSWVRTR
jgi:Putative MetA-pathway of phenol degradation